MHIIYFLLIISIFNGYSYSTKPCIPRKYNHTSIVCVCNATYCDESPEIKKLPVGKYVIYESTMDGLRFSETVGEFYANVKIPWDKYGRDIWSLFLDPLYYNYRFPLLKINRRKVYQTIIGFGGAFTVSAGFNIKSLSNATQNFFYKSYFSKKGLKFNLGRVPIGSSDFALRRYTFQDFPKNDKNLTNFSIPFDDYEYKIDIIKNAVKYTDDRLLLMASSFSIPLWMKKTRLFDGSIKKIYFQTLAEYHVRFLEEYAKNNVTFWSITPGNELFFHLFVPGRDSSYTDPKTLAYWITNHFKPTLNRSKFHDLKIYAFDDNLISLPLLLTWVHNRDVLNSIDGIAFHWYLRSFSNFDLDILHFSFPNKSILMTEACTGNYFYFEHVALGSWSRGEWYMNKLIHYFNHWNTGWIDWNLALDDEGGPSWIHTQADSPIIVLKNKDEFLKQSIFYALGHFSVFVPRGSKRIQSTTLLTKLENVAFLRPDGAIVIVFYNPIEEYREVFINEVERGWIRFQMKPRAFYTVIYW